MSSPVIERLYWKLIWAFAALVAVMVVGTIGYRMLVGKEYSWFDGFYMTFITVATIGYGEIIDLSQNPAARVFTVIIGAAGLGTLWFMFSTLTVLIVEGDINLALRRSRMEKTIRKLLAARNTGAMSRLLDRPFCQKTGEHSYSIYMIHVPLMSTFLVGWLMFRAEKSVGVDNASALALSPAVAWGVCVAYAMLVLALDRVNPEVVMVHNDIEPFLRCAALWAKQNNVPCLHIPHAIYQDVNRDGPGTDVHDIVTASHPASAGSVQTTWYKLRGFPAQNIRETGMPQYDEWATR